MIEKLAHSFLLVTAYLRFLLDFRDSLAKNLDLLLLGLTFGCSTWLRFPEVRAANFEVRGFRRL